MSNKGSNTVWHHATVTRERRATQNGHRSAVVWFTGLSGSGKSTLAHAVEEELHQAGCRTFVGHPRTVALFLTFQNPKTILSPIPPTRGTLP